VGNDGEDDISLYHVSTKSRTTKISISLIAVEIMGDSGYRGGRLWGGLCDHCDLIRTACQAAGVENANGWALEGERKGRCELVSRAYPKSRMRRRKATGMRKRRKGDNTIMRRGDDVRRMKKGMEMAKTATSTTDVMLRVCIISRLPKRHALDARY
jgi:hypothetical protein